MFYLFSGQDVRSKLHLIFILIFFYRCNNVTASDRFVQRIFLSIIRCIGTFITGNGCDVIYVSLLSRLDLTISYPISYMAKFCAGESSKQKESKMSKTYQKSSSKIRVRSLYLSPILHWFYPVRYVITFWCDNIFLTGDFKNTKV